MKIAILTSGGDAPGMNSFVEFFAKECEQRGFELLAVKRGYQGLIENDFTPLYSKEIEGVFCLGGSILKSYRSEEFLTEYGFQKAVTNLKKHKINVLVALGGEGTMKGLKKLSDSGVDVVGVPATIDNDMAYTHKTIGFDSAVNSVVEIVDKIKQTLFSADRGIVIEVMGRYCGDIALYSGLASNADIAITNENSVFFDNLVDVLRQKIKVGNKHPVIIVQENILDIFALAEELEKELGIEFRANRLGYAQRGGTPSVSDRIYAKQLADNVARSIKQGVVNVCFGEQNHDIVAVGVSEANSCKKLIDNSLYKYFDWQN